VSGPDLEVRDLVAGYVPDIDIREPFLFKWHWLVNRADILAHEGSTSGDGRQQIF